MSSKNEHQDSSDKWLTENQSVHLIHLILQISFVMGIYISIWELSLRDSSIWFLPEHPVTTSPVTVKPLPIFQTRDQGITCHLFMYTNLYLMTSFLPSKVEYCDTGGIQNNCAC